MGNKKPYRPKNTAQLAKYIADLSTGEISEPKQEPTEKPVVPPKSKGKPKNN